MGIEYVSRDIESTLLSSAAQFPVVVLTGARQTGKSTTLRRIFPDHHYITLDDPLSAAMAVEDPRRLLEIADGPLLIDEIQYAPDLLSYIKMAVDERRDRMGQFILTGSQVFPLMSGLSETLAGRAVFHELFPLSIQEFFSPSSGLYNHLLTGFFPDPFLHGVDRIRYYGAYVQSYLERDIRQVTSVHDLGQFRIFLELLAARCGALLNLNDIARDCGISFTTARRWLSLLESSRIVYLLRPWHRTTGKRLIKSPKLYFIDTGLVAWLLRYTDGRQLEAGPMRGAVFENFIIMELLKRKMNRMEMYELFFYRDSNGNEIDLVLEFADRTLLLEIQSSRTLRADFSRTISRLSALFLRAESFVVSLAPERLPLPGGAWGLPWRDIHGLFAEKD